MKSLLAMTALMACAAAFAQHVHETPSGNGQAPARQQPRSSYAGMQDREIKALSGAQIADLRAGKGMSLALPAELNGYPGPLHVLELAAQLGLSDEQRRSTRQLAEQMKEEAAALGEQLIASEHALDRLFKERTAGMQSVQDATARAADAQARLRAAHLRYHLYMAGLLSRAQIDRYGELRGYR